MTHDGSLTLLELTENIKSALQQWHKPYREDNSLTRLLLFQQASKGETCNIRRAINQLLLEGIEAFDAKNGELAAILQMRFLDDLTVQETARRISVTPGTIHRKQREGWEELARILYEKEQELLHHRHEQLLARLEVPTYAQLWGMDGHLHELADLLRRPEGPPLIAVEGIGGIGKTSLTDALLRHLIWDGTIGGGPFVGCVWVTARPRSLNVSGLLREQDQPAMTSHALVDAISMQLFADEERPIGLDSNRLLAKLKQRLAERPHLIVVDNLETVLDSEALLDTLRQLVNPTRVLLTTRHNLFSEPDVYHFPVPPLTEQNALALVRDEARRRNLPHLSEAGDEELHPIYKTVGGNPLALRLVVGQTHVHALQDVLSDLTEAQGEPVENLYIHIYWRAWKSLNEAAREAWLLMPLVNGEGMTVPFLAEIAEAEVAELRDVLDQLVRLNLVDRWGNLKESRYSIHPLTRTFLQVQILKWGHLDGRERARFSSDDSTNTDSEI